MAEKVKVTNGSATYSITKDDLPYYQQNGFKLVKMKTPKEQAKETKSRENELEDMTNDNLKMLLGDMGIDVPAKANKDTLVKLVLEAENH